jgi:hypothetical protein
MADFRSAPLRVALGRRDELRGIWERLEYPSGFPEPYLSGRSASYRRWSGTYSRQLVRENIRDLGGIRSAIDVETLYDLLPSKVGSPLSVPSLAQDLKVACNTVHSWLALFERFFLTFSLPTWTARVTRAIHKERKVYLLDAPRIEDPAARFENLAALELWRAVSCWNALGEGDFSLHFVRNKEKQEADFLIIEGRKPLVLIETNLADEQPSKALVAIQRQLGVPAVQLLRDTEAYRSFKTDSLPLLVAPAWAWLAGLPG